MKNRTVLISGASIAGPALAYWLARHGFEPTVVERAPAIREGGHAVDFRGAAHLGVLERMGVLEAVRAMQTRPGDTTFIDAAGRTLVTLPASFTGGDVEIERGDLARILYDATRGTTEYRFDDAITSLDEHAGGVDVGFRRGAPRTFDLVVGADGLHSGVRALAFGDESQFLRFHGYYAAVFTSPNALDVGDTTLVYSEPGRAVTVRCTRDRRDAMTAFVFASPPLAYDRRDVAAQKQIIAAAYADVGWEAPRLLDALHRAPELYFDAIGQVDLARFTRGRVALVGDAGYGGTLGGQGTGLAVIAAYILAGELGRSGGDHAVAFAQYEAKIGGYARGCQQGSRRVGSFYAPTTRATTWLRNAVYRRLTSWPMKAVLERIVRASASAIELEDYATGEGPVATGAHIGSPAT